MRNFHSLNHHKWRSQSEDEPSIMSSRAKRDGFSRVNEKSSINRAQGDDVVRFLEKENCCWSSARREQRGVRAMSEIRGEAERKEEKSAKLSSGWSGGGRALGK